MNKSATVTIKGVDIVVSGDYIPYTPAKITADPSNSYPAEGGCLDDDYTITIGGEDVTELLAEAELLTAEILSQAEYKIRYQDE